MSTEDGSFEVLEGYPEDVVAISAHGHISRQDYEDVLIPLVEARIKKEGKVKLLYVCGSDFEGLSAGAALDDAKLGLLHLGEFARVAVVADADWIRLGVRMFAPLMRCPVHLFHLGETEVAKAWLLKDVPEDAGGPEVAADRKLPTLEDKM
ncbi:SpoIIAA family protein [Acidimangrovimonas pyrenivorans]|uniref:STAS/SEC14 domain-containing protein n=1 Tax=Acidimangrovimonas pyrenivorans TaxID=2030798 RepID=A0ABV7AID3_9RHOB